MANPATKLRPPESNPVPSLHPTYLLGHSSRAAEGLGRQARQLNPLTRELFRRAGLTPGMRVLDVGCGVGDVAFLAADIVGPTGSVLGIDRSDESLWTAKRRALDEGRRNVAFSKVSLDDVVVHPPVDAVVGRLVLMHLRNPVASLASLIGSVKPGGLVIFHEYDLPSGVESLPACPLFDSTVAAIRRAFELSGHDLRMWLRLRDVLVRAGLQSIGTHWSSLIEVGDVTVACELLAEVARSAAEAMTRAGYPANEGPTSEDLAARLADEVRSAQAVVTWPSMVGAWGRVGR